MAGKLKHAQRSQRSYHTDLAARNGWKNAQYKKAYERSSAEEMKRRGLALWANNLKTSIASAFNANNRESETREGVTE